MGVRINGEAVPVPSQEPKECGTCKLLECDGTDPYCGKHFEDGTAVMCHGDCAKAEAAGSPMGVSEWWNHGEKHGYVDYFRERIAKDPLANVGTPEQRKCGHYGLLDRANAVRTDEYSEQYTCTLCGLSLFISKG